MRFEYETIGCIVLAFAWFVSKDTKIQNATIVGMIVCMIIYFFRCKSFVFRLNRIQTDGVNELIVIESILNNHPFLFMLDTGYAGPPVISRSYLSIKLSKGSLESRYNDAMSKMTSVTTDDEFKAINNFINKSECLPYTSGCTMKLMGIGQIEEHQADLVMCPMLRMRNTMGVFMAPKKSTQAYADMFVTNSLKNSIHILTCDYLLHHSPAMISFSHDCLELNMSMTRYNLAKVGFTMLDAKFSGGSFVVDLFINNNALSFTVDTGSPTGICVGQNAAHKVKTCNINGTQKSVRQGGINGEVVCSDIVESEVTFCGSKYIVPIFINNMATDFVDGYIGIGFLRGFDILMTHETIGFAKNNVPIQTYSHYTKYATEGNCGKDLACLKS
tara:strand:+ start:6927 stop:8087 length:1161 start_codon:yes stop_codon:yes gene_type:complete